MKQFTSSIVVLGIITLNLSGGTAESCQTPGKKPGECIVIRSCGPFLKILEQTPVSKENVDFLRKSQCGSEGRQPKVCCPVEDYKEATKKDEDVTSDLLPDSNSCGQSARDRIVGGRTTGLIEYPWMALLQYQTPDGLEFLCGGALINKRYVLTAAHCVSLRSADKKLVGVRLGEHTLNTDPDCEETKPGFEFCSDTPLNLTIEETVVHEQYFTDSLNQHNDIALIRLNKDVDISGDFVKPVCLPTVSRIRNSNYDQQEMITAGWGRTEKSRQSNVKLQVNVPIIPQSQCVKTYADNFREVIDNQFCAGGVKDEDSCSGDSGGPLMFLDKTGTQDSWYIYGVVSYGPVACGLKDFPGIYTKVPNYIKWIVENLKP